jgi:pilus assembly protein CpaF
VTVSDQVLGARVRQRILDGFEQQDLAPQGPAEMRLSVRQALHRVLEEERMVLPAGRLSALARQIADDIAGLGPVEALLRDPGVTEVMINGSGPVYVERAGHLEPSGVLIGSDDEVLRLIERVVAPLGLRIDESSPYVEARLPDGSRLHAIIPPLAVGGPAVTIRKFARHPFTLAGLVANGTMTPAMARFLELAVRARLNVVVTGGTGSGKTTLLSALCSCIPEGERLVTIEETAELRLDRPHLVALEARPPSIEGTGEVTVRALVRNALRMRPDRIVVGECRGGEALDMLQAMNTGHDGSLSTCHANAPADLQGRLETMVLQSGLGLSGAAARRQVAAALDLIVHTARLPDGSRRVVRIAEVGGLHHGSLVLGDVFWLVRRGSGPERAGGFMTGPPPLCLDRFADAGLPCTWPPFVPDEDPDAQPPWFPYGSEHAGFPQGPEDAGATGHRAPGLPAHPHRAGARRGTVGDLDRVEEA